MQSPLLVNNPAVTQNDRLVTSVVNQNLTRSNFKSCCELVKLLQQYMQIYFMQSTRNIGILTMNCQDCKTQEQRNRRHFFCGFIQNQLHLLKREQQTITTLYEIRYLFLLFTKIIIMMMMMNMLMTMIIIIIRNITMSYQGWIKLEDFTKIQGFFSISVLLLFAIRFF